MLNMSHSTSTPHISEEVNYQGFMNKEVDFKIELEQIYVYSLYTGLAVIISQNYWYHVTSTLYKPDTSLRQTVVVGPDGVCLRES